MAKINESKPQEEQAENKETFGWDDMRELTLPVPRGDEEKEWFVSVNGRSFQVPCGVTVKVPYPIYERCMIRQAAYKEEQEYRNQIPNESAPGMKGI